MATRAQNDIELETRDDLHVLQGRVELGSMQVRDGGYGWVVVFACFVQQFLVNGLTGSWGVMMAAILLQQSMQHVSTSTISFVGSLVIALTMAFALGCIWLARRIGSRLSTLIGVILFFTGTLAGSFATSNVAGLFVAGTLYGLGSSLMYNISNTLPFQWFDVHLGTANGLVKLGGGVGATVMSIVTQLLINRFGIAWTFRSFALIALVIGLPAALLIKDRGQASPSPFNDSSKLLFRNGNYALLFMAGFIGIFALYVPAFFLPTIAMSIGLSATTAAGVMACYNACMSVGRFASGIACDKFGSTNMLFVAMALNAITMLGIWSVASTLAMLSLFAALNGIANGAFFVTMPTAIGKLLESHLAASGVSIAVTGWTVGDLLGNPIAGFLIAAAHADKAKSIVPYRAAIFYAGGTAAISTALVLVARVRMDTKVLKKL